MTASILLLSMTRHLTQDVAPVPFLWVLPLSLYLFTFVLAFDHPRWYKRPVFVALVALTVPAMAWLIPSLDLKLAAAVFFAGWLGSTEPQANLDAIASFVRTGGGLFIADYGPGYSWWWGKP